MTVSDELARRDALQPGMLVGYDTIRSGQVLARIVARDGDTLTVRSTADRYAYPRGFEWTMRVGPFVYAR